MCSPEGHLGSWPSLRQQKLLVLLLQHFSMGDLRKHQQYIFTLENSFSSLEGKSSLDSQQLLPNMFLLSLERQRKAAYLSKHQKFAKCQQCTLLRPQSEFFNFEVSSNSNNADELHNAWSTDALLSKGANNSALSSNVCNALLPTVCNSCNNNSLFAIFPHTNVVDGVYRAHYFSCTILQLILGK